MNRAMLDSLGAELRAHGATSDDFVIFGSTVMLIHGLREEVGDIDLFVRPKLYAVLSGCRTWHEQRPHPTDPPFLASEVPLYDIPVHAFASWTKRDEWVDADACFEAAERVHGWPCIPLSMVADHKYTAALRNHGNSHGDKHSRDLDTLAAAGILPPAVVNR